MSAVPTDDRLPELDGAPLVLLDELPDTADLLVDGAEGRHAVDVLRLAPGERIRVLRVIARMNVGGPALQVAGLTVGLDERRFESRLLTGCVGEGEGDYLALRAPDVPHAVVPGLGRSPSPVQDLAVLQRAPVPALAGHGDAGRRSGCL